MGRLSTARAIRMLIAGTLAVYLAAGLVMMYVAAPSGWRVYVGVGCAVGVAGLLVERALARTYARREDAAQLARESARLYRELFDNAQEGLYQSSPEGHVIAANPALLKLLGVESFEQLQGLDVGRDFYVDPRQRRILTARLEREGVLHNVELRLKRRDGGELTVLENARTVHDSAGAVLYYEGSLFDITERKRAEQALEASVAELEQARVKLESQARQLLEQSFELAEARDRAVAASRLKSEFLASLSREMHAPLHGVLGISKLLLDTSLAPQQREFAETVGRSAQHLLAMLSDVVDYARLETGPVDIERAPFSLRECVEGVLDQWAAQAENKGLEMPCRVASNVPDGLLGDAARVKQILSSLVGNAIRFTECGEVQVTVTLAHDSGTEALLRFQVEDSGAGIAPDSFVRLFEPYSQRGAVRGDRLVSSGLGLAIARKLVERMGGRIGVDSEPGQGSLFWFLVGMKKEPAPQQRLHRPPPSLAGRRILVADDVASCRGVLAELVAGWGMKAETAADGIRALDMLRAAARSGSPFDFAVLDHDLPGMRGLDLAEVILDEQATASTRPILLIPYSQRSWRNEPVLAGAHSVLTKPVRESEFREALVQATEQRPRDKAPEGVTAPPRAAGRGVQRVLIVEDNLVNQRVAQRLLEKLGYRVDVVNNGVEAVEAMRQTTYHAILMDCQMPEMDGFAATAAIRQLALAVRPAIIAMTANAMTGDRERCLASGMDDYLHKPVSFDQLRAAMERWIGPGRGAGE